MSTFQNFRVTNGVDYLVGGVYAVRGIEHNLVGGPGFDAFLTIVTRTGERVIAAAYGEFTTDDVTMSVRERADADANAAFAALPRIEQVRQLIDTYADLVDVDPSFRTELESLRAELVVLETVPLDCVAADSETGEWIGQPTVVAGKRVILADWLNQPHNPEHVKLTTWSKSGEQRALVIGFIRN